MARQDYVKEHQVFSMSGQTMNIYGLTKEGWEYSERDKPNWIKSRYRANTHKHEMTVLKVVGHYGFEKFSRSMNIGGIRQKNGYFKGGRLPDLRWKPTRAVEIELTIKSRKRYIEILGLYHRKNIKSTWFVEADIAHRLARNFSEIINTDTTEEIIQPQIIAISHGPDGELEFNEYTYELD